MVHVSGKKSDQGYQKSINAALPSLSRVTCSLTMVNIYSNWCPLPFFTLFSLPVVADFNEEKWGGYKRK